MKTIKKKLLIPGVPSLGESCQGECPGLGELLILSGWCLNQECLSKRFEQSDDEIGQPAPVQSVGFPALAGACPPASPRGNSWPRFLLALIVGHIPLQNLLEAGTSESDTLAGFPERATAFLSARSLLSLSLLPEILFMRKQLHHTPLTPSPG